MKAFNGGNEFNDEFDKVELERFDNSQNHTQEGTHQI
jgi:hypothetical protein